MSSTTSIPVSMKAFQKLVANISPSITVCVRGRHAVGKSEGVYQAAKLIHSDFFKSNDWALTMEEEIDLPAELKGHKWEDGLPVIERRLSQMTEGDIIGLPRLKEHKTREGYFESTQFKPCDWLIYACRFPVVLFLDERNRALEGVKQAVFQLTDSKAFYGYKLHPETRIVIAENVGDSYQVQECDPAEVSRCATVTLEPSFDEWVAYATPIVHPATLEFIKIEGGKKVLEHLDDFEPNKKYQDRRSWVRLDQMFQEQNMFDDAGNHLFYVMSCSMLGVEVGSAFTNYCRARDFAISAVDILDGWSKIKKRLSKGADKPTNEIYIECGEKIGNLIKETYSDKKTFTDKQQKNLADFLRDCPPEIRIKLVGTIQKIPDLILYIFPLIKDDVMSAVSSEYVANKNKNAPEPAKARGNRSKTSV